MALAGQYTVESPEHSIPATMQAAVYRGVNDVRLETVPVPPLAPAKCSFAFTPAASAAPTSRRSPPVPIPPLASSATKPPAWWRRSAKASQTYRPGDRVMVFHHIPCRECFYCQHKTFAQCATYKKVGCTAGFEPSGGGFAEYVRVMDWIVEHGTVRIPDGVSFEQACFVEPVNTCMKGIEALRLRRGETVLAIGQGPIGIILSVLAKRAGATLITSDLYPERLRIGSSFGLDLTIDASRTNVVERVRELTEGRGADAVILAVGGNSLIRTAMDAARPGGRVLLFAQTQHGEAVIDPAAICVDEKTLVGSYSASVDLQEESVRFVMNREMDLERLDQPPLPAFRRARKPWSWLPILSLRR